ncbi:unnamed protein product [Rotaria socialis]|uniref:G-protein coupled receptors family 1 profile domain-containing protein n=2 Tax=Rotaria socialis TaxID=392032 RepID=A0A818NGU4_9BILA|nr:unnamed protein product [Rotaria socialis]CAF3375601.1 unnamed protein product [Rotaria socialis]CAF3603711.1 unnamed protein product [Rotaria socialis]
MRFSMYDYDDILNIATTSMLCLVLICGICGNAIVLVVGICRRKYQHNVTNCYIMNLAITDLLFLLISVPLTTYLAVNRIWIFGQFICKMHIYLAHVLLQATCLTLAAMSIDRYLTIVHEICYRKYRKPKTALLICVLIWAASCVFMFPYDYLSHRHDDKNNQSSVVLDCTVNDNDSLFSSCLFTFLFYYLLPLLIIGLCYSRILLHVQRSAHEIAKQLYGQPRQSINFKKRRVQRTLLALTLAFALCWLPIHVLELLSCSQILSNSFSSRHVHILTAARAIAHGLSYFNSCLNPLLYAILNKSYFSSGQ